MQVRWEDHIISKEAKNAPASSVFLGTRIAQRWPCAAFQSVVIAEQLGACRLKSVLRLHGASAKGLQNIGHDFRKLRARAEKYGLDLQGDDSEILKLMADGDIGAAHATWKQGQFERRPWRGCEIPAVH
jgi:hypothetical protein